MEGTQDRSARDLGQRNVIGQRDVTTCFYAFSDIPKSLEICNIPVYLHFR